MLSEKPGDTGVIRNNILYLPTGYLIITFILIFITNTVIHAYLIARNGE